MRIYFTLFSRESIRKVFLSCLVLFTAIGASAYSFEKDGIYYTILEGVDNQVEVSNDGNYGTYSGSVTIPAEVTNNSTTYTVTSIAASSFQYCSSLKTVDLSNCTSLVTLGDYAFSYCESLESVTLPSSVTSIGASAFYYCKALTTINFPSVLTNIGTYAFYYCIKLASVTLPSSLVTLGANAFQSCTSLTNADLSQCTSLGSLGSYAFFQCTSLSDITLPSTLSTICNNAFSSCTSLTTVTLPGSVTTIENYAFHSCTSLSQVVCLAPSAPTCGDNVFYSISSDCALYYPSGATGYDTDSPWSDFTNSGSTFTENDFSYTITYDADAQLTGYSGTDADITIPSTATIGSAELSVTSIGKQAFYWCTSLASVTLPSTLTEIGLQAFCSCTNLATTNLSECTSLQTIGEQAFYNCKDKLTSIDLSQCTSLTTIGNSAFSWCTSLESVTLPSTLTTIGISTFQNCTSLTSITSNAATPPTCTYASSTFSGSIYEPCTLTVPEESLTAYQTTEPWSSFYQNEYSVTISDLGYATFYVEDNVKIPSGVTAYYGTLDDTDGQVTLTLNEIESIIPASTAVVLAGASGPYTFVETSTSATTTISSNALCGTTTALEYDSSDPTATEGVDGTVYTLAKVGEEVGFYKYVGSTLAANKAWLEYDSNEGETAEAIKTIFAGEDDDEATAIADIQVDEETTGSGAIYSLAGQRVNSPLRGSIYIKNGKKFVAK